MTIALWQKIAAHYRDETAILGYDLLNEPISPYSDVAYLNPRLEPLYRDIVTAIRRVDPNHAVLLGGAQWDTNFAVFDKPFDDNAIYTYHKFWVNPSRDGLQEYLNFSNRWHVPILIGETGEFNNGWNDKFRRLNESFGFGWIFWPYKNLDSDLSVVTVKKPAGWDLIASAGSQAAAPCRRAHRRKPSLTLIWRPSSSRTSASTMPTSIRLVSRRRRVVNATSVMSRADVIG